MEASAISESQIGLLHVSAISCMEMLDFPTHTKSCWASGGRRTPLMASYPSAYYVTYILSSNESLPTGKSRLALSTSLPSFSSVAFYKSRSFSQFYNCLTGQWDSIAPGCYRGPSQFGAAHTFLSHGVSRLAEASLDESWIVALSCSRHSSG